MATAKTTSPERRAGAINFFNLLQDLDKIPDVLLPGKAAGDADSTTRGLSVGEELIADAFSYAGWRRGNPERAAGFAAAMSYYLMHNLSGFDPGYGDAADDAEKALREVEIAATCDRQLSEDPSAVAAQSAGSETVTLVMPSRSVEAGRRAAYELDALLEMVIERAGPDFSAQTEEGYCDAMRQHGLAMRMRDLTSVLMSIVTDDAADPGPLEERLFGRARVAVHG